MATAKNSSSRAIRNYTKIWLIGQPIDKIAGMKLPSNGDVLRRLFHCIRKQSKSVNEASKIVLSELKIFWEKAHIPIIADYNVIPKLEKIYNKWRAILKGKSRQSKPQKHKEMVFKNELNDLFDIAHADALNRLTIEEDKSFLLAQREKGRRGCMSGIDKTLANKEARKQQRVEAYENRRQKQKQEIANKSSTIELYSSNSSSEGNEVDSIETINSTPKNRKRGRQNVVTKEIASALDRSQVSDRKAVFVLSAVASSLGHDVQTLALNRSSIRRGRNSLRCQIAKLIKETFASDLSLTVHWDGKLLPDVTGNEKVDRLPVLVSGANKVKLLGVPKLPSGTGKCIAKAVVDCLEDWGIKDRIKSMSFDTTASNTGHRLGSCTLIEKMLDRELLYLACRHHILEIIAEKVFATCHNNASTGPEIKLFQRFQDKWNFINREQFETRNNNFLDSTEIIEFCQRHLQNAQPRDDYQELLELTIIYLGAIPFRGIHFRKPGALHRARWMSRIIYAIKICLFQSQFEMSRHEKAGLKQFTDFVVTVYIKY